MRNLGYSLIWKTGKILLSRAIIKKYNIKFQGKIPKPPFLLIANHTHFLDAFFIMAVVDIPITWVVATGTFHNKLLGPFLKTTKMISKQKGRPDVSTVKEIFRVLGDGGVVGIFPEGSVTWDGEFQSLPKGTEKLLEHVKTPIVATKVHGGYLTQPRWAEYGRKGRVEIHFNVLDSKDALSFLKESEWKWQKKNMVKFLGKNKAKGMERIVWFCSKCGKYNTMVPKKESAYCLNCGFEMKVDDYGYINGQTVSEILRQQERLLTDYVNKNKHINLGKGTLKIRELISGKLLKVLKGNVSIIEDFIRINEFPLYYSKIKGETTFLRRIFEFIYEDKVMRLLLDTHSLMLLKFFEKLRGGEIVFQYDR